VATITADSHIVLSKNQASCDLVGETAIVNLRNGIYYGLDPMGTHIWTLLREPLTFAALCESLVHDYDVEASRLETDMRDFLAELVEQGLVEIT
jgi:hypothetical protein